MTSDASLIPVHLGFIQDGNRRWAKGRGLTTYEGHMEGYNAARRVSEACFDAGVKFVSLYAFSTENWRREAGEVSYLMKLLALAVSAKEIAYAKKNGVRLRFLGRRDHIDGKLLKAMEKAEGETEAMEKGTLAICLDYGGQQEIADAAGQCIKDGLTAEEITPDAIEQRLYAADIPPIDMVVRSSGEQRISNFMLWRIAYSEFLFLQKHWPEMTKDDVTDIIEAYGQRSRRFGG
jgi:undecaprenyl diphosphate synthase